MIPSTLTGILLFLVLLLPGFVFVTLRERHQPTRKLSVFRETSVVLAATTGAYALPALTIVIAAAVCPLVRSEVALALSGPASYASEHAFRSTAALGSWVLAGSAMAALLGSPWLRPLLVGTPGGSAWWKLFAPDKSVISGDYSTEVTATLEDGSVLTGTLYSWNRDAEDTPDREFTLQAPIWLQAPDSSTVSELDAATVAVSARVVRYLTVRYLVADPSVPSNVSATTSLGNDAVADVADAAEMDPNDPASDADRDRRA
ncbi:hypothetical protein KK092_09640 [Curtobacterium flaccumfaciens pv. flaccumfaciens]|uniref:DUF6338 family protein n=1 Tax=Curtobacterium flaccumfaciens TaxID=2035 RepID=UPI001BDE3EB7|nr:DUF6338 family protein [Curtobacterium flaccumfaciens]MBT1669643.1 hypothetical protein [Curtobacterium flaccumfaciens pv. flaccumfaciens]